jgi:hypothetical protein
MVIELQLSILSSTVVRSLRRILSDRVSRVVVYVLDSISSIQELRVTRESILTSVVCMLPS